MAPKCTKSTAKTNVASKRPCRVTDLETKLQVIKDQEIGKSMTFTMEELLSPKMITRSHLMCTETHRN
jgi:hypothetical protein